jgi:CheY-like chemotaxis protein
MNVLVVEDEVDVAEVLKFVLESDGYGVTLAGNGREALERLAEMRPDLVVTDMMMPYVGGRELARAIAADERYRTIPIIAMTAAPNSIRPTDPFVAVVHKPFDLEMFVRLVRRFAAPGPS